jgi:Flp pilus assembly protein TadG
MRPRGRGQALVELAIILPVLLLLMLAALDLGRIYYARITVANAARSASMYAAETASGGSADTAGALDAAVNEARNSFVTVAAGDVTVSCTPSCAKAYGNRVTARVDGHFTLVTPLLAVFLGGQSVTFSSTAEADIVYIPPNPGGAASGSSPTPTPTPTATPTPTPTPTSSPVGATPTPTATPTATPSPTPTPCPLPFVDFSWTQQNKNKPVVFTSSATPTSGSCAIINWRWDYGDSTTDTGNLPTVSHDFPAKGATYNVTLTVTVPGGITNSTTKAVTTQS